ncbi:MAG: hypothetical protein P8J33_05590 [Pirellulaceae bacterium]|nr:hypothetical protein [Pirellulaceae bacterium]
MLQAILKLLKIVWASPNSSLGLAAGLLGLPFGTRMQYREGCIEFFGGMITGFLRRVPPGGSTAAMTLGHVILGQSRSDLSRCRAHEQVHVRQYEQWGPFFLPAYFGWSCICWLQSRDAYLDNPFEVEAYRIADPRLSQEANPAEPETVKSE